MSGDYTKINSMTEPELREFALFAYTAYPTLLETHERRIQFAKDHPDKTPHRTTACPDQLELPLV